MRVTGDRERAGGLSGESDGSSRRPNSDSSVPSPHLGLDTAASGELFPPIVLDFLWEALHAGELPYPLEVRSHGETMDERASLRRQVHEDLRAAGLLDATGRLEPHLEDWLGVLANPTLSIDSVFLPEFDAEPVSALAGLNGGTAILATQTKEGLRLRKIHASGLASAIVDMLPPAGRGTEQSITLPAEEFAPVRAGVGRGPGTERTSAVETRQALARLSGLPSRRGGQLAANSRSPMRGRRRSPVLAWFDNETGRYLSQARVGSDGREWVTLAPADAATLRHRLTEMVAAVTDGGR